MVQYLVTNDIFDDISALIDSAKILWSCTYQKFSMLIEKLNKLKALLANPITLKNYFENNDGLKELGGQEYLVKDY